MRKAVYGLLIMILILFQNAFDVQAQTTGKIAGIVLDKNTDEPLPGANIFIEETSFGTATDLKGEFYIINVPPGLYTLNVQMIGYTSYQVEKIRVSVNRTVYVEAELSTAILEGEVVVVQAEKISKKKDQTSSIRNISSDQINLLPVENIESVVNLQAGVIDGHFRGGRKNEVSYMIDGIQVIEPFGGENSAVSVETDAVEEIEVITGTFNAEYGRAMSGIVNAVTKEGGNSFHGAFSSNYANYLTSNTDIFTGLDDTEFDRLKDLKFLLSGPLWKNRISFFVNMRWQDDKGYLNGIHRFNVDDFSNFAEDDPSSWYSEHSGDSSYVSLNYNKLFSIMGKLTSKLSDRIKLSFLFTRNDEEWGDYDHQFKYNPDGLGKNHKKADMYMLQLNHMITNTMFYDFKLSYVDNNYGWYVFENPEEPRYVHNVFLNNNGPGFYTGGQQKDHTRRTIIDRNAKFDLNWQIHKKHLLKTGVLATRHYLNHEWHEIQNAYKTREEDENFFYFDYEKQKYIFPYYEPVIYADSTIFTDAYRIKPVEFSAYFQDKMEFDQMVVNIGIRYDYFDPNTTFPSQRRNPANQLDFPDNITIAINGVHALVTYFICFTH